MSETKLPSLTFSIVQDDKISRSRAFGFKNVEAAIPANVDSLYCIGSVTKSFTALAISKLVENGKLDFHDAVPKFIPALNNELFEKIEIHHLLSHTSGIPGLGWAEVQIFSAIGKSKNWLPISSIEDMASFLDGAEKWKGAEPGSKYFYLNEGYYILGEIISRVSGVSYFQFLKENILNPLRMNRTFVSKEDVEGDGNYSLPYVVEKGRITRSVVPWGSGAAGGIFSNVLDLSSYISMYLNKGQFLGKRIIGEDMIRKMETPYGKPPASIFPDAGYGYGLSLTDNFFGERLVRHDGSISVYTSGMAFLPEKGIGISLLCNGSGYSPSYLTMYALSLFLGKDPEKELAPVRRERTLKKLAGSYRAYKGTISARVKREGDFLLLSGEDIGSYILVPDDVQPDEHYANFFTLNGTAKMGVEFRLSESGTEMIFERYKYRKVERPS